jgi:hypothetical protein
MKRNKEGPFVICTTRTEEEGKKKRNIISWDV